MSFASSYHVFYWLQLPKKKKGPLSPDIFQAKIHVKCSSFRDMGPVRPKSGKQDVQTGPGQGRHLPSPSDQKIDRRLPGLTTVSLRDRFWRFQPNRSSPPRGFLRNYFTKFRTRPPSYPPQPDRCRVRHYPVSR